MEFFMLLVWVICGIIAAVCILYLTFAVLAIMIWVIGALGLKEIGIEKKDPVWGMAFVPILNRLTVSYAAFGNYVIGIFMVVFEIFSITCWMFLGDEHLIFQVISVLLWAVYFVLNCISLYFVVYKQTKRATMLTVLNIFTLNLASGFIYFYVGQKVKNERRMLWR